ncbi:hypothetical protein [Roseomonas sp. BN140053]|uniref:hypothetical protein n=1 Tax=Roseomonas sp. BN140053 TaxID=3391898 RepID=UPI0039EB1C0F
MVMLLALLPIGPNVGHSQPTVALGGPTRPSVETADTERASAIHSAMVSLAQHWAIAAEATACGMRTRTWKDNAYFTIEDEAERLVQQLAYTAEWTGYARGVFAGARATAGAMAARADAHQQQRLCDELRADDAALQRLDTFLAHRSTTNGG